MLSDAESPEPGGTRLFSAPAIQMHLRRASSDRAELPDKAPDVVSAVRSVLEVPDDQLDYARAKVALDELIDPDFDRAAVFRSLDQLTAWAMTLTRGDPSPSIRLGAVRRVIYESGPWNDHRPFAYDMDDPSGLLIRNKLLHNYLQNRLGQCVSMPVLYLIIADRLGLDVALALAPHHLFIHYTDEGGRMHNLETTSGGHPTREQWLRQEFPMTDRSIETGIYLRSLSKREAIAVMASTILEYLFEQRRSAEVIGLSELILRYHPNYVEALLSLGSAAGCLQDDFKRRHPIPGTAPLHESIHVRMMIKRNRDCFRRAEDLGWLPAE
jgi:regulator of sirC expression with transglutaminase-like and TPR domain